MKNKNYLQGIKDMKREILNLIKENKELESISYSGKKVYKLYYKNIIKKIRKLK